MPVLTILSGDVLYRLALEISQETLTVRELIARRVHDGVAAYNERPAGTFRGLVQPTDSERALNGYRHRTYWESYSFGDLSEVAKTRRTALERLVPRLKPGRVSEIKGNFLEVQGHHHRYKIHLGSGNILMADGDRYPCIVPDSTGKALSNSNVFLPLMRCCPSFSTRPSY